MSDELQLDANDRSCASCERELRDTYYLANGAMVCTECKMELEMTEPAEGSGLGRFSRAIVFGALGGALGAGLYFGILKVTGYEVGLVAIVVGFLVGVGVRTGSGARGGWLYQLLAVGVTYASIVSTYVPFIVEDLNETVGADMLALAEIADVPKVTILENEAILLDGSEVTLDELRTALQESGGEAGAVYYHRDGMDSDEPPQVAEDVAATIEGLDLERMTFMDADFTEPVTVTDEMVGNDFATTVAFGGFLLIVAAASPFLGLPENLMGLAIIGFALYQAWSMNRREQLEIEGPLEIARAAS